MIIRPIPFKLCALCLLLASCAVPNSGAVDEISTSDIPFGLNSPETSVPATTTTVVLTSPLTGSTFEQADLYFVDGSALKRLRLEIPTPTDLQGVFAALVAGLPDSMNAKVKTVLPVDFAAVIDVEGGVANVNAKRVYLDSIKPNEQRLAIARAIADQPEILLLDEPFGHLDANLRARLTEHLIRLREEENTTIILVSHEGQDVLGLCDSICILKNGTLSKKYKPEFLYYHYSNLQQARLFGPVNAIKQEDETILFRPDEYRVSSAKDALPVEFIRSIFVGGLYHNYFQTETGETIVLYQFERLNDTRGIEIVKKTQ
jgi:hypothetical protein